MTKPLIFIACLYCAFLMNAQTKLISAGGNAASESGSLSYSIGQVFVAQFGNESGEVIEGIQYAYSVEEIEEPLGLGELLLNIYPNPVTDKLVLDIDHEKDVQYDLKLTTLRGDHILQKKIEFSRTELDLGNLTIGTYVLTIYNRQGSVKSFKIVKQEH